MIEFVMVAINHIWTAMLRQAPISGVFDLFFYALTLFAIYGTYRLWSWVRKEVNANRLDDFHYIWPASAAFLNVHYFVAKPRKYCSGISQS